MKDTAEARVARTHGKRREVRASDRLGLLRRRAYTEQVCPESPTEGREGCAYRADTDGGRAAGGLGTTPASPLGERLRELAPRAKQVALKLCFVLLGVMFGSARCLFDTRPIGIALLAATGGQTLYVFTGLLISTLLVGGDMLSHLISAAAVLGIRLLIARLMLPRTAEDDREGQALSERLGEQLYREPDYFRERPVLRLAAAIAGAIAGGTVRLVSYGMLYYDAFALLFSVGAAAALCLCFTVLGDKKKRFTVYYEAALLAGVFCVVWSMRDYSVFGFSPAVMAAFFITLIISRSGGLLHGGIAGMACGLGIGFAYAPVFAAGGIACALFSGAGKLVSVAAAALATAAMQLGAEGIGAFSAFVPDVLAAAVLSVPVVKYELLPKLPFFFGGRDIPKSLADRASVALCNRADMTKRMEEVTAAFGSLSEACRTVSGKDRAPTPRECYLVCTDALDSCCRRCPENGGCFRDGIDGMESLCELLASRLRSGGALSEADLPDGLRARCTCPGGLTSAANLGYARLVRRLAETDKTKIFAEDYEAISEILSECAAADEREYTVDEALSERVREAVGYLDFYADSMTVFGERRIRVVAGGVDLGRVKVSPEELRAVCEKVIGRRLSTPAFSMEGDYVSMSAVSVPSLCAEGVTVSLEKKDEAVSGDSSAYFTGKDGMSYLLISDGMGSGREAAITSRIAVEFLRRMLSSGIGARGALDLLNNFIRNRREECFATVDLLQLDCLSGDAKMIKSGAAPSFVIRDGSIFRISSGTIPVGIAAPLSSEQVRFTPEDGDVIVMMSDGVAQSLEDCAFLADLIIGQWCEDLGVLADKILRGAAERSERRDDMTVGLCRVKKLA